MRCNGRGPPIFDAKCVVVYSGGEADQTYPLLDMMADLLGVVGSRKGLATEGQVGSQRIVHSGFSLSAQSSVEILAPLWWISVALALGLFGKPQLTPQA